MSSQLELFQKTMEEILTDAYKAGRIPIECVEEYELPDGNVIKSIEFHEA